MGITNKFFHDFKFHVLQTSGEDSLPDEKSYLF